MYIHAEVSIERRGRPRSILIGYFVVHDVVADVGGVAGAFPRSTGASRRGGGVVFLRRFFSVRCFPPLPRSVPSFARSLARRGGGAAPPSRDRLPQRKSTVRRNGNGNGSGSGEKEDTEAAAQRASWRGEQKRFRHNWYKETIRIHVNNTVCRSVTNVSSTRSNVFNSTRTYKHVVGGCIG